MSKQYLDKTGTEYFWQKIKAYVGNALSTYAKTESPNLTGTPTAPTAPAGTSTVQIATTDFVQTAAAKTLTSTHDGNGNVTINIE